MSNTKLIANLTPAHLRPMTVHIPQTWTPDQALAVFELRDELREKLYARYGCKLRDLLAEQQGCFQFIESDASTDRPF